MHRIIGPQPPPGGPGIAPTAATGPWDFGIVTPRLPAAETTVALGATIYSFEITLNDADRGVYEALSFRVARHPSETAEYLLTRVLAYCLEYTEGIQFSKGLSEPDVPALAVRDLTGVLLTWIDIGAPEADRLRKAASSARRVAVYSHRDVAALLERLTSAALRRAEEIEIYAVDRELLAELTARLDRRMSFDLSISERHLYLTLAGSTLSGQIEAYRLPPSR